MAASVLQNVQFAVDGFFWPMRGLLVPWLGIVYLLKELLLFILSFLLRVVELWRSSSVTFVIYTLHRHSRALLIGRDIATTFG